MPDMEEDNFCSTFYISELQYNSIENNFGIDIFECWGFPPISHLRHLFSKNKLKFKLYERLLVSAQLTCKNFWMIISERNFDQIITFPSIWKIDIK